MNTFTQNSKSIRAGVVLSALVLLATLNATADTLTNVFTGAITLDGDISDFFDTNGVPLSGVCLTNDLAGAISGVPGSEGLNENPLSGLTTKDSLRHPSGFNQRRIMSAYNPALNGGTIFVGVDLPGGTDSIVNANFSDGFAPVRMGPDGILAIRPFDADGNGEPDTIGYDGATPLRRCSDPGVSLLTTDVIDCSKPDSGGFTDVGQDAGNKERYFVSITFGDGTKAQVELFENNTTPAGTAGLSVGSIPAGKTFGALANRSGTNSVLGFDVEFAITNVNANVDECRRLIQTIEVNSGSVRDGSPNGEDFNRLICIYVLPPGIAVSKQCPPTNAAPGTLLVFTGTVTNTGQVTLTNVSVFNDQPSPDTLIFGPITLGTGEARLFTNSYTVPANYMACAISDTLTARGNHACTNIVVTATASNTCSIRHTLLVTCPSNLTVQCLADVPPPNTNSVTATSTAGGIAVIHGGDLVVTQGCVFVITRTYEATDACTNQASCAQIITVMDTTPPVIVCQPGRTNEWVTGSVAVFGGPTASDTCDTNVTVTFVDSELPASCPAVRIFRRTWTATDDCTNRASCSETLTFVDTTPPVIVCQPDSTNEWVTGSVPVFGEATATDTCDTNVTVSFADSELAATCPAVRIARRTWTATDDCTNQASCSQTLTFVDTTQPVIACPPDRTNEWVTGLVAVFGEPTASDNCDTNVTVTFVDSELPASCPAVRIFRRTWTATDDCTNRASCSQALTFVDTTPPVIACSPDRTNEWVTGSVPVFSEPTASDTCDTNVTVTFVDSELPASCPAVRIFRRTWTATDDCTNRASCSETLTFIDTTPPVIVCQPDSTNEWVTGSVPVFGEATATDTCDTNVTVSFADSELAATCPAVRIARRTWTATDDCTNQASRSQTLTFVDTTPPVIACPPDRTNEWVTGLVAVFGEPTASDNCDTNVTVTFVDSELPASCPAVRIFRRTWTATDDCTNRASCSQTLTFVDTTPPVIACPPDRTNEWVTGSVAVFGEPTASDTCDTNVTVTFVDSELPASCPAVRIFRRTWTATDDCTNRASCSETLTFVDTTPPVIACSPDRTNEWVTGSVPVFSEPTASDTCDTNVTVTFVDSELPASCPAVRIFRRTWTATDDCTNRASCSQALTFVDTTPPVIACSPDRTNEWVTGSVPVFSEPTASDTCDTNVTLTFVDSELPANCPAVRIFRRTWTATDDCTNSSSCSQTLTFIDTTPPLFVTVLNRTFQCLGDVPAPSALIATDNCDTNVVVTRISTTNGLCPTIIIHTWTATDDCTNSATTSQTNIVLDTIPPVLSGVPTNQTYQCLSDVPPAANVAASDNCDGTIPVTTTYTTNGACPTIITCTWTARDRCTNSASATRTITVNDTIPPVLSGVPTNQAYQCLSDVPPAANVAASDNCDGTIPVTTTYTTNGACPTIITCTWTARDRCTNSASATRTITVNDTIPPVLSGVPTNQTYQCLSDVPPPANVAASDNCDGAIPVTATYTTNGACPTIITCAWTARDRCTNSASATRTITVQPPPVLVTSSPSNQLVCVGESSMFCVVASHPCGVTYAWRKDGVVILGANGNCLTIASVAPGDAGVYCVEVTGSCSSVTNCATLTLKSTVGDFVWEDLNFNGCQDANEPGISNVLVHLIDCATTIPIRSYVTDVSGRYRFDCVEPGNYRVLFIAPSTAYMFTTQTNPACGPAEDSDASMAMGVSACLTLPPGTTDLTRDAGLFRKAAIGDYVWLDLNQDGIQDTNEVGVPGVRVKLMDCAGNVVRTTNTDASGLYLFTDLAPTNYNVMFNLPAGWVFTRQDIGGDDAKDSDANPANGMTICYTLISGQTNRTVDAGLIKLACLGDFVWEDLNRDGIQTNEVNTGLSNIVVQLIDCGSSNVVRTTNTDVNGFYLFCDLMPGPYRVQVTVPMGYRVTFSNAVNDCIDSDANAAGLTDCVTLTPGETNLCVDIGLFRPAAIGDFVWHDLNTNGVQDVGEPGISNVTVRLMDCASNVLATSATDMNGLYLFNNLMPGGYRVQFVAPAGYVITLQDVGANDAIDSDANPGNGISSACYTLISGQTNRTVDAGLILLNPRICVTKKIACLLPGDNCGVFGKSATGFKSATQDPAFCYSITVSNCGQVTLTNVTVVDDKLAGIGASFPSMLAPGQSVTNVFKMSWNTTTTNVVTASGQSAVSGQTVTTNDSAVAVVKLASVMCAKIAMSADDQDGVPADSHVTLPNDGQAHNVTYSVTVTAGDADLANVTISDPVLAGAPSNCVLPAPFALAANSSVNVVLCTVPVNLNSDGTNSSPCANPLLNAAAGCTVLQLGGGKVSITGPAGGILGDVCIGPNGKLDITGSEYVTGLVRLAPGATYSKSGSGTVGGVIGGVDLSAEINAALAAAANAAAQPCTQNIGTLSGTQTINGNGGLNVICIQDIVLNGKVVTLNGGASDVFILNITGKMKLNGTSKIVVAGGVLPKNVLYNVIGTGQDVAFTGGGGGVNCCNSSADGTLLAPQRKIALSPGLVNGAVISGKDISIVSGSSVRCPPVPPGQCEPLVNTVTVTAQVSPSTDRQACAYDQNGNPIRVSSQCSAAVECGPPQAGCPTCDLRYPFVSANPRTSVEFNESEVLRAFSSNVLGAGDTIKMWYNDEHAMVLGVRRVIVKTGGGSTTNNYPITPLPPGCGPNGCSASNPQVGSMVLVGDQAGTDISDRPMYPALFITDVTADPNSLAGDWQFGGAGIPPHAVFGTWKGAVRTVDQTKNPVEVTVQPDADPPKNNWNLDGGDSVPPGSVNQGYGALARWNVDDLGLIPGHTYRAYFMVHDGDQNKEGGDVGHGCVTICFRGPPGPTNCIRVIKEVACLLPGDQCGPFGKTAIGYKSGLQPPGFCYRITVTNCGPVALTNLMVTDNLLGNLTASFFANPATSLAPGAAVTKIFKMALGTDTTNTVAASGKGAVAGGQTVTSTDSAVALVDPASIICQSIVTSPGDQDGNPFDIHVQLPTNNSPQVVSFVVVVCNNGPVGLANVTVSAPALAALGCNVPAPFALPAGACFTNVCQVTLTCANTPVINDVTVTAHVDTAGGQCGYDFNGTNIIVQSGCSARVDCQQSQPCLRIIKSADKAIAPPFSHVIYTYTVTNCGAITLSNVVVTDDNGTPDVPGDDFIVGTINVFPPGAVTNFTRDVILPVTICGEGSSTASGMIIIQALPGGNIKASFVQAFDVNDNTYGVNSIGWGGPNGHKFSNLTGSDHAVWEFRNGAGQVVLRFAEDYISSGAPTPSGFGTLGFGGDGDAPDVGNAAHVLAFDTSLTENLNKAPFLNNLAQYTVNSPSLADPNSALWEYRMIYTVVISNAAFGPSGFGSAAIIDQHNSPGKRSVDNPQPCDSCVTNIAVATTSVGGVPLSAMASAVVCTGTNNVLLGAIGDFVWHDLNGDGDQDAGEPGVPNVTVELRDCGGNLLATTNTAADGLYLFGNLPAGSYKVTFLKPGGSSFTTANVGSDSLDSDAHPATGMTACVTLGAGETNLTVDAGLIVTGPPCVKLFKTADQLTLAAGGQVTYHYTVSNGCDTVITDVAVHDDNGTPDFAGDDFMVGTVPSLAPGQSVSFSRTIMPPVKLCMPDGSGTVGESGTLITQILPDGNIKAIFIQDMAVNDNTYGANAMGWPGGHTFGNLTGSDQATFSFRDANGQVVLAFKQDYISASGLYSSGYGTLGVNGGDGGMITGNALHVLEVGTSLTENLNQPPFLNNLGQYTVNSPSLADPNSAAWEYRMIYTVVVDQAAFGAAGLGQVAITDQHNSPTKPPFERGVMPNPCGSCVTNTAVMTALSGNALLIDFAQATVCLTNGVPPTGGGQCPHNYSYWKKNTGSWPAPYSAGQTVVSVFDKAALFPGLDGKTLLDAVSGKAGADKVRELLKHGVTALLNAASPQMTYPFTTSDVVAAVNMALMTGTEAALKDLTSLLKEANEQKDCH